MGTAWIDIGYYISLVELWKKNNSSGYTMTEEERKLYEKRDKLCAELKKIEDKKKPLDLELDQTESKIKESSYGLSLGFTNFAGAMTLLFLIGLPQTLPHAIDWCIQEPNKLFVLFGLIIEGVWTALFPVMFVFFLRDVIQTYKTRSKFESASVGIKEKLADLRKQEEAIRAEIKAIPVQATRQLHWAMAYVLDEWNIRQGEQ